MKRKYMRRGALIAASLSLAAWCGNVYGGHGRGEGGDHGDREDWGERHEEKGDWDGEKGEWHGEEWHEHLHKLPPGHIRVFRDRPVFFSDGLFYEEDPEGFFMINAPIGAVIPALPSGRVSFFFGGMPYYVAGPVFYRTAPGGFVVVNPPIGAVIPALPPGSVSVVIGGTTFYHVGRAYFRSRPGGFIVVSPP